MFIQSQQLVTSSSSSNGAVQPKRRKTEHYVSNGGDSGGELVDQVFAVANQNVNSSIADFDHASPSVGNQQPFVRASTIKLLDTYQRCGQKVGREVGLKVEVLTRIPSDGGKGGIEVITPPLIS